MALGAKVYEEMAKENSENKDAETEDKDEKSNVKDAEYEEK